MNVLLNVLISISVVENLLPRGDVINIKTSAIKIRSDLILILDQIKKNEQLKRVLNI